MENNGHTLDIAIPKSPVKRVYKAKCPLPQCQVKCGEKCAEDCGSVCKAMDERIRRIRENGERKE